MSPETNGAEENLVERIRHGDRAALESFIQRHGADIRRALRVRQVDHSLQSQVDSEDLVQTTLRRLWENAGSLRAETEAELLAWLLQAGRHRRDDHHRRRRLAQAHLAAVLADGRVPARASAADGALETKEWLAKVLARLSPEERVLLEGRENGRSWEELAAEVGRSPDALRKQLARALDRVRSEMPPAEGPN